MTIAIAKGGVIFMLRVASFLVGEKLLRKKEFPQKKSGTGVVFCADGAKLEVYSDRSDKGFYL